MDHTPCVEEKKCTQKWCRRLCAFCQRLSGPMERCAPLNFQNISRSKGQSPPQKRSWPSKGGPDVPVLVPTEINDDDERKE